MKKKYIAISLVLFGAILFSQTLWSQEGGALHPRNKMLLEHNLITYPTYFPEIPRCTAQEALGLYRSGKALIIWIGVSGELVVGGLHLTENQAENLDPNSLPLQEGQTLLLYCY